MLKAGNDLGLSPAERDIINLVQQGVCFHEGFASSNMLSVKSVLKPNLFRGNVAVVTGGGTGIGKAIASELASLGCNVVIASRNESKLNDAAEVLNRNPTLSGRITPMQCNIRKPDQVKTLFKNTVKMFGKLDYLVNNGGGQFLSPAENISPKGWHAVIETNLTGTFYCCQTVFNEWMAENGGVIVNIVVDMWRGYPFLSHTGAARAAVDNLTKSLAIEWISKGVRINSVAPGTIFSETAVANYPPNTFDEAKKIQPSCRLGVPEEISGVVCFLLSPAASFITGETVKVDGAQSLYDQPIKVPPHNKLPTWKWSKLFFISGTNFKVPNIFNYMRTHTIMGSQKFLYDRRVFKMTILKGDTNEK
nr:peroxisomal trans-2-enoyl-CoA reductase-like isoform X1 [Ciona intestinalis]|eukprot:XP_026694592.1 peroxisomal trans-2-enoyl-CoA reductase-like isoform X1 [Ciona intestinalis]